MVMNDDASCTSFPAQNERFDRIQESLPEAQAMFDQLQPAERLAILSGPDFEAGCSDYNCFDSLGVSRVNYLPFKMRDGPRGVRGDIDGLRSTAFAVSMARAASFDLDLEFQVGKLMAAELRALRSDIMLAPTINTLRHPGWARAQETYGEDPVLLGEMGAAFVRGFQDGPTGMPACPKHFAGNNTDENRGGGNAVAANMIVDEQTLRENYTRAFQIVVEKSDPACIMAAYNDLNGEACTQNAHLLTDILRSAPDSEHQGFGWTGFVVSDWWATNPPGVGADAIASGLDVEMPTNDAFQELSTAQASDIDRAVRRVLDVRATFGQLSEAYRDERGQAPNTGIVDTQAHVDLALETALKGAVLLKNEGVLPLGAKATELEMGTAAVASIVVLGPDRNLPIANTGSGAHGLGDRGSSNNTPPHAVSFLQGISARASGIEVTDSADASAAAGKTIAIIPVTMAHEDEGEAYGGGGDRDSLGLAGPEPRHWTTKPTAFINAARAADANVKIVVLLAVGSAIVMEDWADSADAVVQTFYPGQEGGTAVAQLLFGDVNFGGKLPFTVATNPSHYPTFGNTAPSVTFEYLHGYRRFEANGTAPRFWFGHGLSYTTYEYSNLQVLCPSGISAAGRLNVQVTVANTGNMAGTETVQLYVSFPANGKNRPPKELKAFTRVTIEPGASADVQLFVPARDLMHWGDAGWELDTGEHVVRVGPSADPAALLSMPFTVN
jgi:beta-glucosidase